MVIKRYLRQIKQVVTVLIIIQLFGCSTYNNQLGKKNIKYVFKKRRLKHVVGKYNLHHRLFLYKDSTFLLIDQGSREKTVKKSESYLLHTEIEEGRWQVNDDTISLNIGYPINPNRVPFIFLLKGRKAYWISVGNEIIDIDQREQRVIPWKRKRITKKEKLEKDSLQNFQ